MENGVQDLSNDLTQLTTEIKTYQNIGGQAIFEIGRRLKKVKEEDLAHGKFMSWVKETTGISYTQANKFIKIATELENSKFSHERTLGVQALYYIATLPEEEREKEHRTKSGELKKPDEMNRKEMEQLRRELRQRDKELSAKESEIKNKDNQIKQLKNRPTPEPKVVEKEVEIEKIPNDYFEYKGLAEQYEETKNTLSQQNKELREALDQRIQAMKDNDMSLAKNDQLREESKQLEQSISQLHSVKDIGSEIENFLGKVSQSIYDIDFVALRGNEVINSTLKSEVTSLKQWCERLEDMIPDTNVINDGSFKEL